MDPKVSDLNAEMSKCVSGGDPLLPIITTFYLQKRWCSWCVHIYITASCFELAEVTLRLICWCDWSVGEECFKESSTKPKPIQIQIVAYPNNNNNTKLYRGADLLFTFHLWTEALCFRLLPSYNHEFVWVTVKNLSAEYSFKPFVMSQRAMMPRWCLAQPEVQTEFLSVKTHVAHTECLWKTIKL